MFVVVSSNTLILLSLVNVDVADPRPIFCFHKTTERSTLVWCENMLSVTARIKKGYTKVLDSKGSKFICSFQNKIGFFFDYKKAAFYERRSKVEKH